MNSISWIFNACNNNDYDYDYDDDDDDEMMMMMMMMMINVNWGIIHMTQRKMFHAFINQIGRDVVACPLNSLVCNLGTERDLPTCAKIMLFLRASSLTCHSVLPYDYSVIMAPLNPRKKKKIRINPWLVEGKTSV